MTKTKKTVAPKIVRQVGGYFQDVAGAWWLINAQHGWTGVRPEESRALRATIDDTEEPCSCFGGVHRPGGCEGTGN